MKEISSFYPTLLPEQLEDLLPSYIPLFVVRLVTYGGVIVTTYHVDGEPLFFEHGVRLLPSGKGGGLVFHILHAHLAVSNAAMYL